MHHIVYLSQATAPFGEAQLQLLLARARALNAAHGITGVLLYGNEQFLQVLEGEKAAVHARYARIQQDARHRDIITFADKKVDARSFSAWHMAFTALPQQPLLELTDYGYSTEPPAAEPNPTQTEVHLTNLLCLLRPLVIS